MLPEISLNILDIAQNSIDAGATLIRITVETRTAGQRLAVTVEDNGKGMTPEELANVTDPFYTTRTTRSVGLGIPFFKQEAEASGGKFSIVSAPGSGTKVTAEFCTDNIDCMPLGDVNATIRSLVVMEPRINLCYTRIVDDRSFVLDTAKMREILADVPLDAPEVTDFLADYLEENERELTGNDRGGEDARLEER